MDEKDIKYTMDLKIYKHLIKSQNKPIRKLHILIFLNMECVLMEESFCLPLLCMFMIIRSELSLAPIHPPTRS